MAIAALVILISFLVALAAFALGLLPGVETAFAGLPSLHVILGLCGALLVLVGVSLYLLAARGPGRPGETESPAQTP